ncbi:MAG: class 1 fructose-bisphosphatase [Candidatus Peregrinibacteria bacterium]|nr:class 1 fructose-bisphosphatase [Candidatus Peregrinibacteria bacterium]
MNPSDKDLAKVLAAIGEAAVKIAAVIQTADLGKVGSTNSSGEEQVALDILSDQILQDELKKTELVAAMASEEMEGVLKMEGGRFGVVFDPLDGSSLVDVNLAVGTIFGVFEGDEFIGKKGRDMVAAGFVVYGPRTTMMITTGDGVKEYRLNPDVGWELTHDGLQVGEGKMFAPVNLRAFAERKYNLELVNWWMNEQYTLRYSGGMCPDVNQILLKGKGIFSYPGYGDAPNGKLRILFECAPMAFIMEQAGGAASDGKIAILDKTIEAIHQRTPIYIGSKDEVARCEKYLG